MVDESNMEEDDTHYKKSYNDLISGQEKDFKSTLNNLIDVFKFISEKYKEDIENANFNPDFDIKLTRKEEMGKQFR